MRQQQSCEYLAMVVYAGIKRRTERAGGGPLS